MYKEYYCMKNMPFVNDMPIDNLFTTPAMDEVLCRLQHAASNQLFAVVTADPGCGKSTLIRKLESTLPKGQFLMLYLSDSNLTPRWFYSGLVSQLGIVPKFYRGDSKRQLRQQIEVIKNVYHQQVVCVVDEAHLLDRESLEEIRFVLNDKFDSKSPMTLILVGQSELIDTKLSMHQYDAIKQRIQICCKLPHLDRAETEKYIAAQLNYAECKQEIFTSSAIDEIYTASNGTMRKINLICDNILTYAFQQRRRLIDDHAVKHVLSSEPIFSI